MIYCSTSHRGEGVQRAAVYGQVQDFQHLEARNEEKFLSFLIAIETRSITNYKQQNCAVPMGSFFFFFFLLVILRRMGKNKALAHHTSTYFHTRRVSS